MMMHRSLTRVGITAVIALLLSISALSQLNAQTAVGVNEGSELTASASLFGGYDTDVTGRVGSADLGTAGEGSQFGSVMSLDYKKRSRRLMISANGNSDSRYYRVSNNTLASSVGGGANLSVAATSRLTLSGTVETAYQPYFQFTVLPSAIETPFQIPPRSLDYSLTTQRTAQVRGMAGASYKISERSSFDAAYGAGTYRLLGRDDAEMTTREYRGGFSRGLTRYATLRLGYGEYEGRYPSVGGFESRVIRNRTLDFGVHYSRPLSLTRRTTIGFSSGSAALERDGERFFTVIGTARLSHQIGRSWSTGVAYARGLGYVGGFAEPFFTDSVHTSVQGLITRRLRFTASAGYANGDVGLGAAANTYSSLEGESRLEIAVVRERLGIFTSYYFYGHRFDDGIQLPVGVTRDVDRHGIRAGITATFPIGRERKPSVTR